MKKAIITTAGNMTQETYKILCDGVMKKYGVTEIEHITDDSIIGGFLVALDDIMYDMSISSQLNELKKHIKD